MGKNKRWKRKAKRIMGKADLYMCECFFCELSRDMYRHNVDCYNACNGQIRD